MTAEQGGQLHRVVGVPGAVLMGLGSIVGTGVFVSIGVAVGVAGPAVIIAIALAALIATFNGLSSAQLAASHPVSGGSYEYGYRYLNPRLGFIAGWTFLCAKSASAATAALGFAGYVLHAFGTGPSRWNVGVAAGVVAVVTLVAASGMRQSSRTNAAIVFSGVVGLDEVEEVPGLTQPTTGPRAVFEVDVVHAERASVCEPDADVERVADELRGHCIAGEPQRRLGQVQRDEHAAAQPEALPEQPPARLIAIERLGHGLRILRRDGRHDAHPEDAVRLERLQVGLEASAAAGVAAGDGQGDGDRGIRGSGDRGIGHQRAVW